MREITDREGRAWVAEIVSHGRTSGYLNPKVHRPVVQFRCRTETMPLRYGSLPVKAESLEQLSEAELTELLGRAKVH